MGLRCLHLKAWSAHRLLWFIGSHLQPFLLFQFLTRKDSGHWPHFRHCIQYKIYHLRRQWLIQLKILNKDNKLYLLWYMTMYLIYQLVYVVNPFSLRKLDYRNVFVFKCELLSKYLNYYFWLFLAFECF